MPLNITPVRRWISGLGLLAVSFAAPVYGSWVVFPVAGPGESAVVAEQVALVPGGGGLLDYEFLLGNTGPLPIDGFFIAAQAPGGIAAALAAGGGTFPAADLEVATMADPGNGPFPAVGAGGAFTPLLAAPFEMGATNPYSPVLFPFWGFEQFDDGAGGLPATYYSMGWYTGFPGPGALPALAPGFFTRFDLFSTFGPIPGFAGIDPLSTSEFDIFDIQPGNLTGEITLSDATNSLNVCGGNGPACDTTLPSNFSSLDAVGQNTPEPATVALIGAGLIALGTIGARRKRSAK